MIGVEIVKIKRQKSTAPTFATRLSKPPSPRVCFFLGCGPAQFASRRAIVTREQADVAVDVSKRQSTRSKVASSPSKQQSIRAREA